MTAAPDPVLIRYLLGELPADEEAALDERAFVDDAWREETAAAADDLIDAYLEDRLPADRRGRFETRFLKAPQHRERYRLLRDLRMVAKAPARLEPGPRGRAGLWIGLAAAALVVLAWLALSRRPVVDDRIAQVPTPTPSSTPTPEASPSASPSTPATGGLLAVALPNQPRAVPVALTAGVRRVRFVVPAPGPTRYAAQIRLAGRAVWEEPDLDPAADGEPLTVEVPAEVLTAGTELALEPAVTRGASLPPGVVGRVWPLRVSR
jgi:hypothetical protein